MAHYPSSFEPCAYCPSGISPFPKNVNLFPDNNYVHLMVVRFENSVHNVVRDRVLSMFQDNIHC